MALSPRRRIFLALYVGEANFNAVAAARLAGYKDPATSASQIMYDPVFRREAQRVMGEAGMGPEEVVARITGIARADIEPILRFDDETKTCVGLDLYKAREAGALGLINSIAITKDGVRVKFYDKLHALETLARVHKLFGEANAVNVNAFTVSIGGGDPDLLEKMKEAAALRARLPAMPSDEEDFEYTSRKPAGADRPEQPPVRSNGNGYR